MPVSTPRDQNFIKRLSELVEANVSDEKFGVSELASEMGMSRSTIHRRLKAISNQSVSRFIRTIRLKKAKEMLIYTDFSASEVAYKVGFSSPTYFNHCYHKHFGYPPGETKKHNLAGTNSVNQSKLQPPSKNKSGIVRNKKLLFTISATILLLLVSYLFFDMFLIKSPTRNANSHVEKSIIVLPFKNLSPDDNNQYFVEGISEDILNQLTKISGLTVVARTAAEQFRESSLSLPEIAGKTNVNFILKGSIRRQDENVRIGVQLIDAKNGRYLWSENYDRQLADIFAIQSDIAKNVASKLQVVLSHEGLKQIDKQHTVNPEAYDYYLMGRYFWNFRTKISLQKSTEYFEKAIETDSIYALAYAGLADSYYARTFRGWIPLETGYRNAYEMAERALEIDKNLPEAYAVMGIVSYYGYWEWEKARGLFEHALEIDSNCMVALLYYANLLSILGENEKARELLNRAIELEPFFSILYNMSGTIYRDDRKYKESIRAYQRGLEINPDYGILFLKKKKNYLKLGDEESAVINLQKYFDFDPKFKEYQKEAMDIYKNSGIDGLITMMLGIYLVETEKDYFMLARLYALLGQKEEVLFCLDKMVNKNIKGVPRIIRNPEYDLLHSDPRFLALVDRMRLMPYFRK